MPSANLDCGKCSPCGRISFAYTRRSSSNMIRIPRSPARTRRACAFLPSAQPPPSLQARRQPANHPTAAQKQVARLIPTTPTTSSIVFTICGIADSESNVPDKSVPMAKITHAQHRTRACLATAAFGGVLYIIHYALKVIRSRAGCTFFVCSALRLTAVLE
jgi:hypothetical protein